MIQIEKLKVKEIDVEKLGCDLTTVNAARISFSKWHEKFTQQDSNLLTYLHKHNHWTPYGHYNFTFRINDLMFHNLGKMVTKFTRGYIIKECRRPTEFLFTASFWWWANVNNWQCFTPAQRSVLKYWLIEMAPECSHAVGMIFHPNELEELQEFDIEEQQDRARISLEPYSLGQMRTLHCTCPLWMWDQIKTHRELLISSESRRYIKTLPTVFMPDTFHVAPDKAKQGAGEEMKGYEDSLGSWESLEDAFRRELNASLITYKELIAANVAPEEARMVLPTATMSTRMVTAHLDYWKHILSLRLKPNAQGATQQWAKMVEREIFNGECLT